MTPLPISTKDCRTTECASVGGLLLGGDLDKATSVISVDPYMCPCMCACTSFQISGNRALRVLCEHTPKS